MARRTKAEAEQTRRMILAAALDLFAAKGYELTTLDDVARRIRLTKGAVYWHFKSKTALFDELVSSQSEKHGAQIARDLPDPTCLSDVPGFFSEWTRLIATSSANRKFFRMMMSLWWMEKKSEAIQFRLSQMEKTFFSNIENMLRHLQRKGEIRPDADLAAVARVLGALWIGFTAFQLNCDSGAKWLRTIGLGFDAVVCAVGGNRFKSEEKRE